MLDSKPGLVLLLMLVFAVNYAETSLENRINSAGAPVSVAGYKDAYAAQQFEHQLVSFEYQDGTRPWAVYVYSVAYFFLFPTLALVVLITLLQRPEIVPFRVVSLAVAIDYLVCLPWFLFFPVPERWAYPDSNARLLSDLWGTWLIEGLRPISALDNSFPSTHVSFTVIMILVCWVFKVRCRIAVTALGLTVILSTFALGIHWVGDIIAGCFVGVMAVAASVRFTETAERWQLG